MKFQNIILLILILLCYSKGFSQGSKINVKSLTKKYSEFLDKDSELIFIDAYRTIEKNDSSFILKIYNPDKLVLTNYETFSDENIINLEGKCKEWYDNGNLWKEGQYKNNNKSGTWNFFSHLDGTLEKYGNFENGIEEGKWYNLDLIGRVTTEYFYRDGKLDGDYLRFDTLGSVFHKKVFKEGIEIENQIIDSLYYTDELTDADEKAILKMCSNYSGNKREKCSDSEYLRHIYGNISYPKKARHEGIQGKALLRFIIDKTGKITELTVLRGICTEIEKECIKVIKKSPKWIPAIHNGVPIKMSFNMPVNFRLE